MDARLQIWVDTDLEFESQAFSVTCKNDLDVEINRDFEATLVPKEDCGAGSM